MKKFLLTSPAILLIFLFSCLFTYNAKAEQLEQTSGGIANIIPKLTESANDPKLSNGKVYPFWGPICQRYTYSVVYSDKDGRAPEYVKIYFNGKMLDMEKESSSANDYKKGVKYIYKNVPNKFGSNFYYFEASNGLGKARASIIDSPDNGPVLFDADFKHNEIVLIDSTTGKETWRFSTGVEWVGAVALSDDGEYLAIQTSNHIYLFNTDKNEPVWSYESSAKSTIGGDVKGGVAISADGSKIFAALNGKGLMFDKSSNKPVWTYNLEENGGGAYGVDITKNGQYAAVAMAGSESDQNSNVLILLDASGKKLWQYHSSGNWHEVNFSSDGSYIAGSTGCPDRRGYLFSKDSAEPIIKSEPLSKESPIDEARISADGNLIVYGAESAYGAIVLMDRESKQIVWKYETVQGKSVRALSITPSGDYIGAGTFGGDILLFNKNSNIPTEQLKINSAIGAFDIADDGSIFATGSADMKVRVFEKGADKAKAEISLSEYVGEIDISANGKYVAAGTSGAVYFFETIIDLDNTTVSACDKIIEPPNEDASLSAGQSSEDAKNSTGGDTNLKKIFSLPVIISSASAGSFGILLASYLFICRRRSIPYKKLFVFIALVLIVASLGTAFYFWRNNAKRASENTVSGEGSNSSDTTNTEETKASSDGSTTETTGGQNVIKTESGAIPGASACGNSICEPDSGETKENCPRDCAS